METSVKDKIPVLDHEKLDVYHIAIEFVILSDAIIEHIPRGLKGRELIVRIVSILVKMAQRRN